MLPQDAITRRIGENAMRPLRQFLLAVLVVTPTFASAQDAARLGGKQKLWMAANFRTGLTCSATPGGSAVSFSGQASFDASGDSGVDVSISSIGGVLPTISAVAINTKGAGADKGRTAAQTCPVGGAASDGAASCSVSGDPHEATVRFTVPLAALGELGKSKELTGHVTLIKRSPDPAARAWQSKKGYDYYQAQSLTLLATCDSSGGSAAKGDKPVRATYDLVMGKKA
jgi:hypothetical protein